MRLNLFTISHLDKLVLEFCEKFENAHNIVLILDNREQRRMIENIGNQFKTQTEFRITTNDNEYVHFIIERKNIDDLRCSIRTIREIKTFEMLRKVISIHLSSFVPILVTFVLFFLFSCSDTMLKKIPLLLLILNTIPLLFLIRNKT